MRAHRLVSVLCVGLAASATVVAAQPKKAAPKKDAPKADKKTPAAGSGSAAGSAAGSGSGSGSAAGSNAGSAVEMKEDPPPADMNGTDENPDAPHSVIDTQNQVQVVAPKPKGKAGYPIEEVSRPITLPQNMSEVTIDPHMQVSPYEGSTSLRARYGITPKVQIGLTYVLGGVFDDPSTMEHSQGFHPGKAVGLDVTVMLQDWVGARLGVPFYISPLAYSLQLGAPLKFVFADKLALGGLDDLLNIKLSKFAPTFYQEFQNAANASLTKGTITSAGELRFSFFGEYQYEPDLAIVGRIGVNMEDFATGKTSGCNGECLTTFIRAGVQYTPRKYLDLGASLGFDDLAQSGSFDLAGFLAFRI